MWYLFNGSSVMVHVRKLFWCIIIAFIFHNNLFSQSWFTFSQGTDSNVCALAPFYGNLYAGGSFSTAGTSATTNYIARWDGTIWSSVGGGMNGKVYAILEYHNELYAGGEFTSAGGTQTTYIAKWNGLIWSPVLDGMDGAVRCLAIYHDQLYAGGDFDSANGFIAKHIIKFNGTVWVPLATGITGSNNTTVYSMAVSNDELYVGGNFGAADGIPASNIAKWNDTTWAAVGSGLNNQVLALCNYNNAIYVGGRFTAVDEDGGAFLPFVAKWNGATWSSLGLGVNNVVSSLSVYKNQLYVGGDFVVAGALNANHIAKWNGSAWAIIGSGVNARVRCSSIFKDELVIGGDFTVAGGLNSNYLARWSLAKKYRTFSPDVSLSEKAIKLRVKKGAVIGVPNISTAVANLFFKLGKKGATFLGYEQVKPLDKLYGWIPFKSQSGLMPVFTSPHTGKAYPIDSLRKSNGKAKKLAKAVKVSRKTYNNVAWEQGIVFKLNLLASRNKVTPTGFDSLVLDTVTTLAGPYLKGKSLWTIGAYYDSIMTYWESFGINNEAAYGLLQTFVDSVLRPINTAFAAPLDTTNYNVDVNGITNSKNGYAVNLLGVKTIAEVKILKEPALKNSEPALLSSFEGNHSPQQIFLDQNYPNPFNPVTTIRFQIVEDGVVSLSVYDVLGREVAKIMNKETMDAGEHDVPFDASKLSSGVYFYRLNVNNGEYTSMKKMILLR